MKTMNVTRFTHGRVRQLVGAAVRRAVAGWLVSPPWWTAKWYSCPSPREDFAPSGNRFGAASGIRLPDIFSFKAKGASDADRHDYNTMRDV
ncbi:MAG: hypothetical protein ACLSHL_06165 [Alistipes communis]